MSRPVETSLSMSCLMCDWFAEVRNASKGISASFLAEAQAHSTQHEQHVVELIQRIRVYGANYVEAAPAPRQGRAAVDMTTENDNAARARFSDNPIFAVRHPDGRVDYDPSLSADQIYVIERRRRATAEFLRTGDRETLDRTMAAINQYAAEHNPSPENA